MEKSNYHITLDLQESHGGQMLTLHQNDTCRRIYITLTDGGRPYRLGSGCRGVFTAKKSDGAAIFNDCEIEGDTLIYDITEQTTASCGELSCQLRLYGETGELLSTAAFSAMVYPPAVSDDDVVASTPEATALQSLLDRAEQLSCQKALVGTQEAPVILSQLPEGVYHIRGIGKRWSEDTLRTLSTGLYSVSIFGVNRQIVVLPVAGTRRILYCSANDAARVTPKWKEEVYNLDDIKTNAAKIAGLEKAVAALGGTQSISAAYTDSEGE